MVGSGVPGECPLSILETEKVCRDLQDYCRDMNVNLLNVEQNIEQGPCNKENSDQGDESKE